MTVADRAQMAGVPTAGVPADALGAFGQLCGALAALSFVDRILYTAARRPLLWVFLSSADVRDELRVYELDRAYHQAPGAVPLDVHAIPAGKLSADALPPTTVLFQR
jgi:hypothetical protein